MGAVGGALGALADKITQRAEQQRLRQNKLDDEQRASQNAMIDEAIKSGNLSPDQIQVALEQKKKLYPKEAHPLIDKFGEVLGHVFRAKQKVTGSGQAQSDGQVWGPVTGANTDPGFVPRTSTATPMPSGSDAAAPGGGAIPMGGNQPTPAPNVSPMASIIAKAFPGEIAKAKTAAQATLAGNEVIQGDTEKRANKVIEDLRKANLLTPQVETALRIEAAGKGFTVPPFISRPMTGKGLKPDVRDGVMVGLIDPLNNAYYSSKETTPEAYQAIWDDVPKKLQDATAGKLPTERAWIAAKEKELGRPLNAKERLMAHEEWAKASAQASNQARTTLMIVPGEDGQPKVISAGAGTALPAGAVTPQQYGSTQAPTSSTRSRSEFARGLQPAVDDAIAMVDYLDKKGKLGAATSRWNDFMAGKVGASDPEFAMLRDQVQMLQTGMMVPHVGARGGVQLIKKFQGIADAGKMDAATLKAGLQTWKRFLNIYAHEGDIKGWGAEPVNISGSSTEAVPPKIKKPAGKSAPSSLDDEIMKAVKKAKSGG